MRLQKVLTLTAWAIGCIVPAFGQIPYVGPLVGGASGQTLRFGITATVGSGPAGCSALVRILTRDLLPAAEKSFTLDAGAAGFLDVNMEPLTTRGRKRVELLPAVTVRRGACRTAVEVYDTVSGQTLAHMPFGPAAGNPGIPAVGPTLNQMVRFGAARGFDPQPEPPKCIATLAFADEDGKLVGPVKSMNLVAGGSAFLDLDPALLLPASGDPHRLRRLVQPRLLLPAAGGGDTRGCAVSVQVFDQLTGATTATYYGR